MILAAALAAQMTLPLAPCTIAGVAAEARCGTCTVREDRGASGFQADCSPMRFVTSYTHAEWPRGTVSPAHRESAR
jgi:hypothetical protein